MWKYVQIIIDCKSYINLASKGGTAANNPSCNQVSGGSFWFAFTFTFASREEFVDLQVETGWKAEFVLGTLGE